ncbi:hypothetical protein EBU94_02270, partial [bacterium]|nr:hypothetical protein [bacterium]
MALSPNIIQQPIVLKSTWSLSNGYNFTTKKNLVTTGDYSSATLYCVGTQSGTDVFTQPDQSYSVRLVIGVGGSGGIPVDVAFRMGKNSEIIKTFNTTDDNLDTLYEVYFYYNPT